MTAPPYLIGMPARTTRRVLVRYARGLCCQTLAWVMFVSLCCTSSNMPRVLSRMPCPLPRLRELLGPSEAIASHSVRYQRFPEPLAPERFLRDRKCVLDWPTGFVAQRLLACLIHGCFAVSCVVWTRASSRVRYEYVWWYFMWKRSNKVMTFRLECTKIFASFSLVRRVLNT